MSTPPPLLRRPAPAPYFHPPSFFNFLDSLSRGGNQNLLPPLSKKGEEGSEQTNSLTKWIKLIKYCYKAVKDFITTFLFNRMFKTSIRIIWTYRNEWKHIKLIVLACRSFCVRRLIHWHSTFRYITNHVYKVSWLEIILLNKMVS